METRQVMFQGIAASDRIHLLIKLLLYTQPNWSFIPNSRYFTNIPSFGQKIDRCSIPIWEIKRFDRANKTKIERIERL